MDLTSRKSASRSSAVSVPGQGAAPPSDPQSALTGAKRSDSAKNDNELPNMPGMPGDGVNQFFAAMLDKKRYADDGDASASSGQTLGPAAMRPLGEASVKEKKEGSGPWRFLRDLFLGGELEQKPDRNFLQSVENSLGQRGQAPAAPGGGPPQGNAGLFAAMDAPLRGLTPDDIQFANEVDAALARRPRFGVRALSVTVAAMLLLLIIWAALADIDEVTHAEGQVVGSQRTQTIQNLEGGILRAVLVREGQIVEKGDILAQLDNEMAESSYRDAMSKAMENSLAIMRLESELKNQQPLFPADLGAWVGQLIGQPVDANTVERARQIVGDQENAWRSRQEKLNAELDVLKAQYEQRQHDLGEQIARKNQLDRSLAISIEQRDTAYSLLLRNNFSRMEYLGLQQKVVELQGQIDMLAASIPKAQAAADEFVQRIASRRAEQNTAITDEINKRRQELNSLRETLSAGSDRVTRTELRTPVRGTVKQIYINTVGGVVKPGEPIMDIVPLDDTLLVEARVIPKDVAFLRPGQDVMVKISAYDFSIYGGLEGKLESISADTIEDKRGNYHYLVKVRTQKTSIVYHNEVLPIIPGMMVTTDIMIGKKTVLDYLLKPILKAKQNALRER
ncbi:MAG: HlyD family type I secretion periplasmic adaptor subunit [Desulfovibrio sp.]|jgi:adhesin transport system membrane fusion protein|nr:HlyD family type I secretion periplasmic adaptor subunit [Desulfovibrio sp.]